MKTLLIIKEKEYGWLRSVFPARHPLLVTVCNKPLLEYLLDFAILCGSRELRLTTDGSHEDVETYFGDGSRWGVKITYAPIREADDLEVVLQKNSRFSAGSPLLIVEGFFFLHYDKRADYVRFMQNTPSGEVLAGDAGRILVRGAVPQGTPEPAGPPPSLALTPVRSISDLHRLSLNVLSTHDHQYVLPGYSNDGGMYIGRNVMIATTVQINKPVMIGNNVRIHKGAVIGPDTAIGNNVIVDAYSRVRSSIVLDKTYVGQHLEIKRKIICGQTMMDPGDGTAVRLEDAHLLSEMARRGRLSRLGQALCHRLLAALLWAALVVPYAVLSFILKRQRRWHREDKTYFVDSCGRTLRLPHVSIEPAGWTGRLAGALWLDRFPRLGKAVRGKLNLIGHRLLPASEDSRNALRDISVYQPGVFSYAEGDGWPFLDLDPECSERFHLNRRTSGHDFIMVLKAMLTRIPENGKVMP
jgi:hypothetical protein